MEVVVIQPRSEVLKPEPKFSERERLVTLDIIRKDGILEQCQARCRELRAALLEREGVALFKIQLVTERRARTVLILKVGYEEESTRVNHLTVREVAADDVINVKVPVKPQGAHPDSSYGTLIQETERLKIRCRVGKLPANINVPVETLKIGGTICASDIKLPDGVELASSTDQVFFSLKEVVADKRAPRSAKTVTA